MSLKLLKKYIAKKFPDRYERSRSLEKWLVRTLASSLPDGGGAIRQRLHEVARYGCASGTLPELIYTEDCIRFYRRFEPEIWYFVNGCAEANGQKPGEFLDSLKADIFSDATFKIALSWFAVEYVAGELLDFLEKLEGARHAR